jgi:purine-binding chemotaxis protein CheW
MSGATLTVVRQFVVFRIGVQVFATPVDVVEGVNDPERIAAVPGTESVVRGVMNLRGRIVAEVDLASLFGVARSEEDECRLLILDLEHSTVGLLVDAVTEVLSLETDDIHNAPAEITGGLLGVTGVVHRDEQLILCLDLAAVLAEL